MFFLVFIQLAETLAGTAYPVCLAWHHLQLVNTVSDSLLSGLEDAERSSRFQQPEQVDVGHGISGEAWLSLCPFHASQGRSEDWNRGLKCQIRAFISKVLIILVKISHLNNSPKKTISILTQKQVCRVPFFKPAWAVPMNYCGDRADGRLYYCVHFNLFSDPVLPVLKIFNVFFNLQISI